MEYQAFKILTAPTVEPVTNTELKAQLRLDGTDQDTMLDALIIAARAGVEKYLARALITQTLQIFYDYFPHEIELPYAPFQSVEHIKYYDGDDSLQTLSTDVYQTDLISVPGRIKTTFGKSWPSIRSNKLNCIEVQFIAGYGDAASDVPAPIKQLITSIAVDLYEHPELNIEVQIKENKTYNFLALNYKIPAVY